MRPNRRSRMERFSRRDAEGNSSEEEGKKNRLSRNAPFSVASLQSLLLLLILLLPSLYLLSLGLRMGRGLREGGVGRALEDNDIEPDETPHHPSSQFLSEKARSFHNLEGHKGIVGRLKGVLEKVNEEEEQVETGKPKVEGVEKTIKREEDEPKDQEKIMLKEKVETLKQKVSELEAENQRRQDALDQIKEQKAQILKETESPIPEKEDGKSDFSIGSILSEAQTAFSGRGLKLEDLGEWREMKESEKNVFFKGEKERFKWNLLADKHNSQQPEKAKEYIAMIHPFLVQPPPSPPRLTTRPPQRKVNVNCQGGPFAGKRDRSVQIIDLLPFSYELDILEIRLYELEEYVDKFVILESTTAFKKWKKPLILPSALNSPRFQRFRSKIFLTILDDADVEEHIRRFPQDWASNKYSLETMTRRLLFERYVKAFGEPRPGETFFIHGDMDEVPSAEQVAHFKMCRPRNPDLPVALTTTYLSMNFGYMRADWRDLSFPNIFDVSSMQKDGVTGGKIPARTKGFWSLEWPTKGVHMSYMMPGINDILKQLAFSDGGIVERYEDLSTAVAMLKYPELMGAWKMCGVRTCCWNDAQDSIAAFSSIPTEYRIFIPWFADFNRERFPYMFPHPEDIRQVCPKVRKMQRDNHRLMDAAVAWMAEKGAIRNIRTAPEHPLTPEADNEHTEDNDDLYEDDQGKKRSGAAGGAVKYRSDSKCGAGAQAPDGSFMAECNPQSAEPCCSSGGWCGMSDAHCKCSGCIDYRVM